MNQRTEGQVGETKLTDGPEGITKDSHFWILKLKV